MKIKINPNTDLVAGIKEKLKENGGYCPCAILKNEETKCMCKAFLEQTEPGYCTCELFYKEN